MKIIIFVDSLGSGGKERRIVELLKSLTKFKSIKFMLVVMSKNIRYEEIYTLDLNISYLIRKTKKDPRIFIQFYTLCRQFEADIIHCWDAMTAMYAVPIAKILRIKLINSMITDAPKYLTWKHYLRSKITFPLSDLIISNSMAGIKSYNAPQKKSI